MRLHVPLYARILLWFLLNLALLGVVFLVVLQGQFRFGLDALLMGPAGGRFQALAEVLAADLSSQPRPEWDGVLQRFSDAYGVRFGLFSFDGTPISGELRTLPSGAEKRLADRRGPPAGASGFLRRDPPEDKPPVAGLQHRPGIGRFAGAGLGPQGSFPKSLMRTDGSPRYWVFIRVPGLETADRSALEERRGPPGEPPGRAGSRSLLYTLVIASDSLRFGGLLFDFTPWLIAGFGGLLLSMLFWFPLVRAITRSIGQMRDATARIAEGRFDTRVAESRTDELGSLASAINRMATQLEGYVTGQKRFLGDTAHELCSPLARIQMALGILEQRADERQRPYVADLREEVQHMSTLVTQLLSFSKAGLRQKEPAMQPVRLTDVVRLVLDRETVAASAVEVSVDPALQVTAEPELLARALGNIVRNALRYAGESGPITVSAEQTGQHVMVRITDSGPGVPAEALEHLFQPFYRPDAARSQETGGVGLGLAIVKTCVESCGGTVRCSNRQPRGFQVEICLNAAGGPH